MAHFYGTTQGHRGEATRCGTKNSGLTATANGWDIGGEISVSYSTHLQTDIVTFYTTTGSNTKRNRIMSFYVDKDGKLAILDTKYPELLI